MVQDLIKGREQVCVGANAECSSAADTEEHHQFHLKKKDQWMKISLGKQKHM